jgi:leucyl/phenylalanyl-tRNA--protein transferase
VPVHRLIHQPVFPPADAADESGLLAVGGDLEPERLLRAYRSGIFPWYSDGEPILWFSPDPRMVLPTGELRVSRGHRRTLREACFELTLDRAFERVIRACAALPRATGEGTWITADMIAAYCRLHGLGFAHSAEAWRDGELVGGVYGVSLGAYFSGESMFHAADGASLAALIALVRQLSAWRIVLFDCQLYSPHTARLGARQWPRARFLAALERAMEAPTRRGRWSFELEPADLGEVGKPLL